MESFNRKVHCCLGHIIVCASCTFTCTSTRPFLGTRSKHCLLAPVCNKTDADTTPAWTGEDGRISHLSCRWRTTCCRTPPRFGSFSDKAGYNGRPPSAATLKSVCVAVMEGREYWYHRQQQLVDGTNLAGDESHKIVKAIRVSNEKVFHGVYTILNEYGQVVMQVRGGD